MSTWKFGSDSVDKIFDSLSNTFLVVRTSTILDKILDSLSNTTHLVIQGPSGHFWSLTIHHGLAQTLPLPLRLVMFGLVEVSLLSNYYSVAMVGATVCFDR